MLTPDQLAELRWRCRRGMWELDNLFIPFFEREFANLPEEEQNHFIELLNCEDQELFDRFFNGKLFENKVLDSICDKMHEYAKAHPPERL